MGFPGVNSEPGVPWNLPQWEFSFAFVSVWPEPPWVWALVLTGPSVVKPVACALCLAPTFLIPQLRGCSAAEPSNTCRHFPKGPLESPRPNLDKKKS